MKMTFNCKVGKLEGILNAVVNHFVLTALVI